MLIPKIRYTDWPATDSYILVPGPAVVT